MLTNKKLWRVVTWPVLVITTFFVVYAEHWDPVVRAWAQQPPAWDETGVPVEWRIEDGSGSPVDALTSEASRLGNHPVLIYEFVRNQVEYEPYTGTRFGAVGTLERRRGNDVDQAILLAALLRAAYRNLHRSEPDLWLVRGDARLTGRQALDWLGVGNGTALSNYLSSAGVKFTLTGNPAGADFQIVLHDHVWLRGDLEFGPYRGARFVEGDNGILADLDPSFIVKKPVEGLPTPFTLSGIDPAVFAAQTASFAQMDAAEGSARNIPEAVMLNMVDSGASVFRNFLKQNSLTAEQALEQRVATIEQIETLPDALPYALEKRPQAYKLKNESERNDFLARARHKAHVRVFYQGGSALLAEAVMPASELYGKTLAVGFKTDNVLSTPVLSTGNLALADLPIVRAAITLDGNEIGTTSTQTLVYGSPVRLEFAYQSGALDLDPQTRPQPLADGAASKEIMETLAGGMYALAALPGLNEESQRHYYNRALILSGPGAGNMTTVKSLAPSLDLSAQVMLAQTENFLRLGALATGHRASSVGQWTIAGLEPVLVANGQSISYRTPRFVFASSQGSITLGKVVEDANDPKNVSTPAAQTLLQLARDAQLFHAPLIAFGEAVQPVSSGRLLRDANAAAHPAGTPGSPTYAIDAANADLLLGSAGTDRVPVGENLAANLVAQADAGDTLFMPSVATTMNSAPSTTSSLGLAWGYFSRRSDNTWSSLARTTDGLMLRAFSEQKADMKINPAELVAMDGTSALHYRRLAEKTINGAEAFLGVSKSTSQAFVVSAVPLTALVGAQGDGGAATQAGKALGIGAAIILLHALLDEFSRPEVVGLKLKLGSADDAPVLEQGGVFNPSYFNQITALGEMSEIVESYKFYAYDGPNIERGRIERADAVERTVRWAMKGGTDPDVFTFVPGYNASTDGSDYNGPLQIRLEGQLNGQRTRQKAFDFTIDTKPPDVSIIPWDAGREYRGDIAIRGSATDLHFKDYKVEIAPGLSPAPADYRELFVSNAPAPGAATLATWKAKEENASGDYTVRLSAADAAGNTTSTLAALRVRNDILGPDVRIVSPASSPLFGEAGIQVTADDGASGTGVRKLKVWIEYSTRALDNTITAGQTQTLYEEPGTTPVRSLSFPPDGTSTYTIDTRPYQVSAASPFVIHASAEDAFGNVTAVQKDFQINNLLFNVHLTKGIIYPRVNFAGSGGAWYTEAYIFQSTPQAPVVELFEADGTTKIRNLTKSYPSGASPTKAIAPAGTYFAAYAFNGSQNGPDLDSGSPGSGLTPLLPQGRYVIRVTQGSERVDLDVMVITGSLTDLIPRAIISQPMNSILLKDKTPEVEITGVAATPALAINNGRSDDLPIGALLPAARPYWYLAYKPHDLDPITSSTKIKQTFFSDNFGFEANWKEIDHGFSDVGAQNGNQITTGLLGRWDISKLPVGEYDVRLTVTNGRDYKSFLVPGYKIENSTVNVDEDPDDREPGVLKLRQTDFSVKFEGFPVEIARTYNSFRARKLGDFGYGWNLDGLNLKLDKTVNEDTSYSHRFEAKITLPDGRKLLYANRPPLSANDYAVNAFWRLHAFTTRPYGQMLWLPGYSAIDVLNGVLPSSASSTTGWRMVKEFIDSNPNDSYAGDGAGNPDGSLACIQEEDGTFDIFDWNTGRILRRDYGDGVRKLEYVYNADANPATDDVLIQDNLGRKITMERNPLGLVSKITDPRGFFFRYEYNAKKELVRIYDRLNNLRELFYGETVNGVKMPEHYLTRMLIHRSPENTEIKYSYNSDGQLGSIDTGDGVIGMEYSDGIQTVVDEATGGKTEVHYDKAGRVVKQVDPAGVETLYEYNPDDSASPDSAPSGALKSQTVAGVKTSFSYNLAPYQFRERGIDGIAQNFVNYWLASGSQGSVINDFNSQGDIGPGYLTSQQVQPTQVMTPAVENDNVVGTNTVTLNYTPLGSMPDGTGKIYSVTDPEGRHVGMGYGSDASRNETGVITGPAGTKVENTYIPSGDFAGRIATSLTKRDTETLSTTTYTYAKGTAGGFTELNSQISNLGFDLNTIWPGYSAAFVEKQFTQTVAQDNRSSSTSYLDALGNTVATMDGNGKWTMSIADAEGRTLFTKSSSGATTRNTYDESGLLTRAENTDSSGTVTVGVTTYDKQGRQTAVSQDGKQSSATDYVTGPFGTRERTSTDASGNKTTTVTDAAGRTVQEIFEGVKGSRRETNYGYDGFGRRSFTISPRGLATLFTYDEAGRETLNAVFAEGRRIDTKKGYDRFGRLQWDQSPLQAEANPPRFKTYLYKVDKPGAGLTPWTTLDDTTGVNDPAYGQLVRVFFEDNDDVPDNNAAYSGYYEEYQYDSKGRQTGVTKPSVVNGSVQAVTTKTDYNSKEQAEYVTFNYVEGGLTSPTQNVRFQFTYDSRGNRETVIYPSGIVKQWSHNYDSQGDLTSLTETQPGGALLKSDSYVGGMVSQTQDGANNRIVNAYNDFQLLTRKYFASGQTDPAFQHEYQYDDDDRLTDINTYVGATDSEVAHYETRKYDPETGSLASVGKSEGTLGYSYDGKGALSAMSYYGRTTNYEYDFFGRISRSESPEGELVYRYNTVGLKASVANVAERTFEEYEYDALGHVEKLTMRNADGAIIHETDYVLGVDGNRIGAIENHTGSPQVVWSYRYDALERLIKEERVGGTSPRNVEYAYDNDGNRIELTDIIEPGKGRIYEYYTDTQRLRYIRDANNAQIVETYHWNNNGQLIEKITSDGTESYFWGLDGTLAQVTLTDGRVVRYDYDHTGTLIARKVFESSTAIAPAEYVRYLVDSENPTSYSQVVAGIDGITGAVKVLNSFTDRIVAQTTFESGNGAGTSTQFLHADALGSIRSLTGKDATGATFSEHYDYTAFGSKMGGATASTTYAYTGQPRDSLTEMQYHRSRWLNANLGQWSSHDPLFDFPDGFGLAYSYVGNNPIGLVDPSGEGQLIDLAVSGAISGFLVGMGIGAAVGIYKAFFTDVYSETSFLGKIVVVLETMLLEAVKGAIGGAILGPLLGILLKPVEALLGMVMGFLKVHIQRGVTPFIQYLGRIFNGTAFETFLRGIQGSLNNLGSIGGMEVFFAKFAELLGAKLPDALARRGILNIGNIVLRGGGRKAQYDLILQGERYIFNFEMKLTRQAIGSYAELTQDFVRKQAVAAANGLTNQKWSMYIWRGGNSDLVIQNIVNALRAAGIQDPLVVQGFWPCVRDLVGKILL